MKKATVMAEDKNFRAVDFGKLSDLGFPNLSFFGKYCRRAFGLSPVEFRWQNRKRQDADKVK